MNRIDRTPLIILCLFAFFIGFLPLLSGCRSTPVEEPTYWEIFTSSGNAYQRGFQHGQHFADRIRSLYTTLLTTSILPYLNREQPDVEMVMLRYQDEQYDNGKFSYEVMLESAQNLLKYLPDDAIEEMQGVADGANISFDDILVLNTFFDTLMGFRSITWFIKIIQAPSMVSMSFIGSLEGDGQDNDGDGEVDEEGEGVFDPYLTTPNALAVEVPTDAKIRLVVFDKKEGVDMDSIRLQVDERIYTKEDGCFEMNRLDSAGQYTEVIFTPPNGLPAASVVALNLQAGDLDRINNPPPLHARFMRDERITFSTAGYGKANIDIENKGYEDGRTQPPSIGFAVRGEATTDGRLYLAHHFAMLDSNTTHKHTVLFVHRPPEGPAFAYPGWTGVIWGFSGMNEEGLSYIANSSDTLNNPFAAQFNKGLIFTKLISAGVPVGLMGREMLEGTSNVAEAVEYIEKTPRTFGWNFLLADADKQMAVVEVESDILEDGDGGVYIYSPDASDKQNLDENGRLYASLGPDDIRVASHFQKDVNDIQYNVATFNIQPQRYWSSFYFRSLRAFYNLGEQIDRRYGQFDLTGVADVLRVPELVDERDSMNAVIIEPEKRVIHFAMGQVPATDGPFIDFDLSAALQE